MLISLDKTMVLYNSVLAENIKKQINIHYKNKYKNYKNIVHGGGNFGDVDGKINIDNADKWEETLAGLKIALNDVNKISEIQKTEAKNNINKSLKSLEQIVLTTTTNSVDASSTDIQIPTVKNDQLKDSDEQIKKILDDIRGNSATSINTINDKISNGNLIDKLVNENNENSVKDYTGKLKIIIQDLENKIAVHENKINEFKNEINMNMLVEDIEKNLVFVKTNKELVDKLKELTDVKYSDVTSTEKYKELITDGCTSFESKYNELMSIYHHLVEDAGLPKKQYESESTYRTSVFPFAITTTPTLTTPTPTPTPTPTTTPTTTTTTPPTTVNSLFENLPSIVDIDKQMNIYRLRRKKLIKTIDTLNIINTHKIVYNAYLVILASNKIYSSKYVLYEFIGKSDINRYHSILINMNKAIDKESDPISDYLRKYHYIIIKKLYYFTKHLSDTIMTQKHIIDVNSCKGDVANMLTLLNYFKSVMDLYNERSMPNVSIYARINDIPTSSLENYTFDVKTKLFLSAKEFGIRNSTDYIIDAKKLESNDAVVSVAHYDKANGYNESKSKKVLLTDKKYNNSSLLYYFPDLCEKATNNPDKQVMFKEVFDTRTFSDNKSFVSYMSISSRLAKGNGVGLVTYGYSGTGKTYTIFGQSQNDKNNKKKVNGVLQEIVSTINGLDKLELRVYELYGLGVPYPHYWIDKDKGNATKIDDIDTKLYSYNIKIDNDKLVLNSTNNDNVYSVNNEINEYIENVSDGKKNTYCDIPCLDDVKFKEMMSKFSELVNEIESNRSKNERVIATPNNPESSRSIITYDFRVTVKDSEETGGANKVVSFLIIDMPGREEILKTYVEGYLDNEIIKSILMEDGGEDAFEKTRFVLSSMCLNPMSVIAGFGTDKFTEAYKQLYGKYSTPIKEVLNKKVNTRTFVNHGEINTALLHWMYMSGTYEITCMFNGITKTYIFKSDVYDKTKKYFYVYEAGTNKIICLCTLNDSPTHKSIVKSKKTEYTIEEIVKNKIINNLKDKDQDFKTSTDVVLYVEKHFLANIGSGNKTKVDITYKDVVTAEVDFYDEYVDNGKTKLKDLNVFDIKSGSKEYDKNNEVQHNNKMRLVWINFINRLIVTKSFDMLVELFDIIVNKLINSKIKTYVTNLSDDKLQELKTKLIDTQFKGNMMGKKVEKGKINGSTIQKQDYIDVLKFTYVKNLYEGIYINENIMGLLSFMGTTDITKKKQAYKVEPQDDSIDLLNLQATTDLWCTQDDVNKTKKYEAYSIQKDSVPYLTTKNIKEQIETNLSKYKSDRKFCTNNSPMETLLKPYRDNSKSKIYKTIMDFKIFYLLANYAVGDKLRTFKCKPQIDLLKGTEDFINILNVTDNES